MELLKQEQKQRRKMLSEILGSSPPPVTTLDEMKQGATIAEEMAPVEEEPTTEPQITTGLLPDMKELPMPGSKPSKKLIIRKR